MLPVVLRDGLILLVAQVPVPAVVVSCVVVGPVVEAAFVVVEIEVEDEELDAE